MGRPSKLTPELQERIAQRLSTGAAVEATCRSVGINPTSHYNWLDKGRAELARVEAAPRAKVRKHLEPYVAYVEAVEKALAEVEVRNLSIIGGAAAGGRDMGETVYRTYHPDGSIKSERIERRKSAPQWQAAAWTLERKFPDRFGRVMRSEVSGPGGGPVQSVGLSKDEYEEVLRRNVSRASHLAHLFTDEDDLT